jgi:CDGSH-type Zn-finger protein
MDSEQRPHITPSVNGPYWVTDLTNFSNRNGPIKARPSMALCRCGGSANKPFCDGSHVKLGFSSANVEGQAAHERRDYEGREITLHDDRGICSHAGHCTDGLPGVFRLRKEPWIDSNAARREEIIAIVRKCPSGALSYSVHGVEYRDREGPAAIYVSPNGPYIVTGGPELRNTVPRKGASTEHFALCRCGASKNKPYCDGSHWDVGFSDDKN